MKIEKAIAMVFTNYERAKKNLYIEKPISYALYHTWKAVDRIEKPREKESKADEN